ncbi:hypothetical protein DPMN_102261 [Dreissena polymorpha]|uniref:Uncharacterized protein n=1 Tax=Dreissena polymorpha TaxID=45954 RepID=A0A9D4LK66_DREPO|nr:hypothetical protein DPMN_102261 [Dreissena polymorpha]
MVQAICIASQISASIADCVAIDACPLSAEEARTQLPAEERTNWGHEQAQDKTLSQVIDLLTSGSQPREKALRKETLEVQQFLREWKRLVIEHNVLYRTTSMDGQ